MKQRRSSLGSVFLTVVIDLLGFGIVLPLLPLYGDAYGAPKWVLGLLFSSFSAMQFLTAPIWGRLSDRHGRRPVILLGLVGSTLAYALFALAPLLSAPLTWLFVSRILAGGFGGTIAAAQAYIADVTPPEKRGKSMALIGVAFGLGFTIGPAIGGLSFEYMGETGPGVIAASLSFLALLYAWSKLGEPERHAKQRSHGWIDTEALKAAARTPGVLALLGAAFITTICFGLFESTLSLLAKDQYDFRVGKVGWLFSYVGFCSLISQGVIVRRLITRVGEVALLIAGPILIAVGFVGLAMIPSFGLLLAIAPLPVLGVGCVMPSVSSLLSRRTSAGHQGAVLGVNQSSQSLARIIGPFIGLTMYAWGPGLPFFVGAGVVLLGLGCALVVKARPVEDRY